MIAPKNKCNKFGLFVIFFWFTLSTQYYCES